MTYRQHLPLAARPRGQWIGWGASLLAHAGILAWLLLALPKPPPAPPDVRRMRFVLLPPPPVVAVTSVPVAGVPAPASPMYAPAAPRSAHTTRSAPAARAPDARPAPDATSEAVPAMSTHGITTETLASSDAASAAESASPTLPADPAADAPAAPAAPAFDMGAARKTARLIEKHRKDGLVALPKPDPPLQRDDRLGRAIERAHRPDCKSAYAGLSLMAVIPLVKDTLTGTGCKW